MLSAFIFLISVFLFLCRSKLSLGTASLGNVYGSLSQSDKSDTIHYAYKCGMNTFDTSSFYGGGMSEECLGNAISTLPRNDITICTKTGRFSNISGSGSGGYFNFTSQAIEEGVKSSLQRLGVSSIDCLALHDIEFGDLSVIYEEALPMLEHLRATGICKAIGVTSYPHGLLKKVIAEKSDVIDYVVSYNHGTLQNQSIVDFSNYANSFKIDVFEASPLALGYFADGPIQSWLNISSEMELVKKNALKLCQSHGVKLSSVACQFHYDLMDKCNVTSSIMGAKTIDEINDVLETYLNRSKINHDLGGQIKDMFSTIPEGCGLINSEWPNHSGMKLFYEYPGHDHWLSQKN